MIKDSELNPQKHAQKKEDFCRCGCDDQKNKFRTENQLFNKKNDKKNSSC
jgi:hypothetical protein